MIKLIKIVVVVGVFSALSHGEQAWGQFSLNNPYRSSFGGGGLSVRSQIVNRPTVSPYLSLLSLSNRTGVPTYFTQVRPQLEARAAAQRAQRQFRNVQQQFNTLNTRVSRNEQGGALTTGHPTRYMNYLHYYPQLSQ